MKATCIMCGQPKEVSNLHRDYRKFQEQETPVFVCCLCAHKTTKQASRDKNTRLFPPGRKF